MKIGTINLQPGSTGVQNLQVPHGAKFQSAVLLGGMVQVNYSYDGPGSAQEMAQLRVVQNNVDYDNDFVYLDMLVNPSNNQVTHVVYKPSGSGGGPVATPIKS